MRAPASAYYLPEARLRLSPAPSAELATIAMAAKDDAELERASFIVVAIDAAAADPEAVRAAVERAALEAQGVTPPRPLPIPGA